jgi:iron complex outermembrane receptor protein
MMKTFARKTCLFLSLLPSIAVLAEDNDKLESVSVTASRIAKDVNEQSVSISLISAQDIDTVGHNHISQLLNRAAGVWISRGNGQEHLTAIRSSVLTGPGSCGAFYLAEDGIPLRAPGFCNVNALFDVNSEQAQRIEIIRGPGTAVHGSNALNGVINVLSAPPSNDHETRLSVEGGPHNYSRVKFSESDTHGKHGYRLSLQGNHDGGYKDDSGYDQQKLSFRHDYQGETWQIQSLLSASNLDQETAGYILGKDAYKVESRKKENPNPEAFRNSRSLRYYSRFEREGLKDTLFVVTPYIRYTEMEFLQHFLPGTPLEENGERTIGVQTAFYHSLNKSVTLYNGFDMELTKAYLQQHQDTASFASFPTGQQYDYDVDGRYGAWFIGGDWEFSDDTLVNFGVRYDIQFYDYDNQIIDGNTAADGSPCPTAPCRYSRPSDDENRFRNWSFHLGMVHKATEHTDIIVNANQGFRAPQANELYRLQSTQQLANLDEESLAALEWGLRGHWPGFNYQLVAFWMQKEDVIIQDSLRRNRNGGQTEHRGLELELNWNITPTLNWALQASYSLHQYGNDVVGSEGDDLDTAPRQLASTQLGWSPTANSLIELEVVFQGEYYLDASNQYQYPGHSLVNLRWRQQLSQNIYAAIRLNNLTDTDYAERADYAFGNYRYFVGEPRAVYLELGIKL